MPHTDEIERFYASAAAGKFRPASYDEKNHTADILMVTSERVARWYGMLEVDTSPEAMDMSRVAAGKVHLFDSHNTDSIQSIVGNVLSVRYENGVPIAKARFTQTPLGQLAEGMVKRGEVTGASIGFQIIARQKISKEEDPIPVYRAVKSKLMELSLTGIPAQASAGALSADLSPGLTEAAPRAATEGNEMSDSASADALRAAKNDGIQTERKRDKSIRERTKIVGLPEEFANRLIDEGVADPHVGERIMDELAARGSSSGAGAIRVGTDHTSPDFVIESMATAKAARATAHFPKELRVEMTPEARQFANLSFLQMAGDLARQRGVKVDQRAPASVLYDQLAMTTSDFPLLLAAASNKILLPAYQLAQPAFFRIAAPRTFNDFKAHHFLRIGDFPNLLQVGEAGEITQGAISESDQSITAVTYGRTVSITRRIIVNDDLAAFAQLPAMAGRRAAQVANTLGFNLFALNSGAGPDITEGGVATHLWDTATHANYTSSGTAIAVDSLGVGFAAMRKQTSLDGMKVNIGPRYLLVSPDKETVARQYCSPNYQPTQSSGINPYAGMLEPLVDANISGNAWYLFADPAVAETFVCGYVAGYEGPRITAKESFSTDGVKLRCLLDFGCGGVDFRGTYKNAGA